MAKEKRLGRGLEALLGRIGGGNSEQQTFDLQPEDVPQAADADWMLQQQLASQSPNSVEILLIDRNPYQPRQEFDEAELDQLAASLETHGLLQPIVVRNVGERFQLIAGERRFRAARRAGWSEIPVHVLEVDDRQMAELALTENVQRKDLNAIEKATAFARYLEMYGGTHEELAKRLELDRSTVTNLLRLLDLPQKLQESVRKGTLTQGHVRALLPLENHEQIEVAARAQQEDWSVRDTEKFVRDLIETGETLEQHDLNKESWNVVDTEGTSRPVEKPSDQIRQLEDEIRQRLGMKVKLSQTDKNGKGKLVISFANHAEFDRLYQSLCRPEKARAHG